MWLLVALFTAGGLAELIDGTLGMGFGVSTSSFLLTLGFAPAAASASVHAAEIATSLASGTAHLRYGNVDRSILPWLIVPGCLGGVLGALLLSGVSASGSRPIVAAFLLVMGLLIIARSRKPRRTRPRAGARRRTAVIGFGAAALDAFGGGGWGPIATPSLILSEGQEPRKAIGTVNLAEFFVTCAIAATFFLVLGTQGLRFDYIAAVAAGGVLAAPVGAQLAQRVPARLLGEVVGALLIGLNMRTLATEVLGLDARVAAVFMLLFIAPALVLLFGKGFKPAVADPQPSPPERPRGLPVRLGPQ